MLVALYLHRLETLAQLALLVSGGVGAEITRQDRESTCAFVRRTLVRFRFQRGLRPVGDAPQGAESRASSMLKRPDKVVA